MVAYAEKRGNLWRARWRAPDGMMQSKPGFTSRKDAENFGRDQEAAVRANTYVDPRAGRITLTDWVNLWYPALDLEPATLANYRYYIEVHILPAFGDRTLASLTAHEISTWERQIVASGHAPSTARDARTKLITVLGDAIPQHIQVNPAQRRRGKGRKGRRRIELHEKAEKAWPTPLQALQVAERCAALSGCETDFVMIVTIAYTGMRWSEAIGLTPGSVRSDQVRIEWKLYELRGRFYRGRPKDGSIRPADLPPFLAHLIAGHLRAAGNRSCTCTGTEAPWCEGRRYAFLGPEGGHFRRSAYGARYFRPATDGWYPARATRPAMPVLVDADFPFPGRPVPPWPAASPGGQFVPPSGRGVIRLASASRTSGWARRTARVVLAVIVSRRRRNAVIGPASSASGRGNVPAIRTLPNSRGPVRSGSRASIAPTATGRPARRASTPSIPGPPGSTFAPIPVTKPCWTATTPPSGPHSSNGDWRSGSRSRTPDLAIAQLLREAQRSAA